MRVVVALFVAAILFPAIGPVALPPRPGAAADERPDIVLVLVDDLTEADWRSLPKTKRRLPAVFPN